MKSTIHRLKTTYDEQARTDKQKVFQQTRSFYQDKINYSTYADSITDTNFAIRPLEIGFVQSLALKDDIKFKQIRLVLQKYNEQAIFYASKSVSGLHLKTVVMDSMLKFIRLMLMAPDVTAKKRILDVAYYWFKKNLHTKSLKKSKQTLQNQVKQILLSNKLLPKALVQKQLNLPSIKRQEELMNYKIQARTNYPQLDAPYVQLQNYITHKVGLMQNSHKTQEENERHQMQMSKQQKWKKRIIFKRPITYAYENQKEEEESLVQALKLQQLQLEKQRLQINQAMQNNKQNQQVLDANGVPIVANTQNGQLKQNEVQNDQNDFGVPQQNEAQQEPELQQQQPQKKRGKLDPLVKIFLLDREKRIKTQGEFSMDKHLRNMRNQKLQKQRNDSIDGKFIQNWAGGRSRFKSELSRKIQSIRAFQRVRGISSQQKVSTAQKTISQARFNQTFDQCKGYLHKQPNRQPLNAEKGISLYDKRRVNTQASWKPFSSIIQQNKRINQKSDYLDQIQEIKSKFAKYKLFAPLSNLKNGILQHEQMQVDFCNLDKLSKQKIDLPSGQLLSNPFAKFGKKKKKKGKKKK